MPLAITRCNAPGASIRALCSILYGYQIKILMLTYNLIYVPYCPLSCLTATAGSSRGLRCYLRLKLDSTSAGNRAHISTYNQINVPKVPHRELGISRTELAKNFGISQHAVSSPVNKGEKLVESNGYELIESKIL